MIKKRFKIILKLYKNEIVLLYHNDHISIQIVNRFAQNYEITIATRTIKKIKKWNIINKRIKTKNKLLLRCRILTLYYNCEFNDVNVLFILHHEKYFFNQKNFVRIKKKFDIIRRLFVRNKKKLMKN